MPTTKKDAGPQATTPAGAYNLLLSSLVVILVTAMLVENRQPDAFSVPEVRQWATRPGAAYFSSSAAAGRAVFYVAEGTATGDAAGCKAGSKAMVLLHGYPSSSFDFAPAWAKLTKLAADRGCQCIITLDFLGFGLSDKPSSYNFIYSIAAQTDIVEELLQKWGAKPRIVIAHNYAVSVAQELMARAQQAAAGTKPSPAFYVFFNGGLFAGVHRPRFMQTLMHRYPWLAHFMLWKPLFAATVSKVFGPQTQPTAEWMEATWRLLKYKGHAEVVGTMLHYMDDRVQNVDRWKDAMRTALKAAKNHTIPFCLVNGPADPVSGRHLVDYFHQEFSQDKRLSNILADHIGHWPLLEAEAETLQAMVQCLNDSPLAVDLE